MITHDKSLHDNSLRMGDPGYLCGKALDMCLFSLKDILRDKQGKGAVLDAYALDLLVEELLDLLPYEVRGGLADVNAQTLPSSRRTDL